MTTTLIWLGTLMLSIALLILTAAMRSPYLHMMIAASVAIFMALSAIQEARRLRAAGASEATIASTNARHMGMVWTWGALGLFATYMFGILSWREWLAFFLAFVIAAGLCLYFAATLKKDEANNVRDPLMKKIGRYLTITQVVGMAIVMIGLIVDGKMSRFSKARPGWEDWAANHFFFFGAMALFAIGLHALLADRQRVEA